MPFQILASIFMIITLYIYHGYETEDPEKETIQTAIKNRDAAITLFYISRVLSGFAAGIFNHL